MFNVIVSDMVLYSDIDCDNAEDARDIAQEWWDERKPHMQVIESPRGYERMCDIYDLAEGDEFMDKNYNTYIVTDSLTFPFVRLTDGALLKNEEDIVSVYVDTTRDDMCYVFASDEVVFE